MLRKLFALCAVFLSCVGAAGAAENDDGDYLSAELNYADLDELRRIEGEGLGGTFLYGFELTGNWFIETRLTALVLERGDAGGTDFYQQDLGVDAMYRFGDRSGWQPFVVGGVSAIRNDVEIRALDDVGAGVNLGLGALSPPLGSLGVRFRMEVRHVHDDYIDGMQDTRLGVGVLIPLGKRSGGRSAAGTPSEDRDSDGVSDARDRCPNSLPYVKHDNLGCMQPNQTIRMYEVSFDNGTAILTAAARAELAALVAALRGQPDLHVRVDGHTDAMGSAAANRQLSLERAEAVATHLTLQGVSTQRLAVKGFGESRPVDSNSTAAGRERNRRIEIVLLEPPTH